VGELALGRELECFIKAEATAGTLIEPDSTDCVFAINTPTITQDRETFDDAQKRNTRSRLTAIAGRYLSGTWGFDTYIRPSGTVGVPPMEDKLVKGLLGTRTDSTSTGCTYTLLGTTTDLQSYSMWFKEGHTVMFCTGATVNQGVFKVDGRNPGTVTWSGGFMKRLWTGTATTSAVMTDTTSTTVAVTSPYGDLYNIGSVIKINSEVMKVTSVATNTLTVQRGYKTTSAANHTSGATIEPWWPTAYEGLWGGPIHGRLGIVTWDAVNFNTMTNEVTITNNIKYYEEEKNNEDFCQSYGTPESRTLEARVTAYFRKEQAKKLKDAWDFDSAAIVIPCGSTAGSKCTVNLPLNRLKAPAITGDAERIIEMTALPYASVAYNDEVNIVYA